MPAAPALVSSDGDAEVVTLGQNWQKLDLQLHQRFSAAGAYHEQTLPDLNTLDTGPRSG
jgi:hypothetical protein